MLLLAAIASPRELEDALLIGTAEGDRQAFTELYRRASPAVYAYALSLLKNPAEAEDVMQDTFLKLRSAAGLYDPRGKALAWILTITRNLCRMRFRQQKHLSLYALEDLAEEPALEGITDVEDRIVLRAALQVLSEEECQIVLLHAVTGWKHREIAGLLQLPLSTVLSKYRRGLKKLQLELEGKL